MSENTSRPPEEEISERIEKLERKIEALQRSIDALGGDAPKKTDEPGDEKGGKPPGGKRKKVRLHIGTFTALVLAMLIIAGLGTLLYRQGRDSKDMRAALERQQTIIEGLEGDRGSGAGVATVTSETIKSAVGGLSELVTQEYTYRNADQKEQSETWIFGWTVPFSSKSIMIVYDGVIKAGVDLSAMSVTVDEAKKTVTVTLPESRVTDNTIPPESISVIEIKNGLFNKVTIDDYNDFITEQTAVMEKEAVTEGLLEKASEEAESLVRRVLGLMPGMDEYTLIVR